MIDRDVVDSMLAERRYEEVCAACDASAAEGTPPDHLLYGKGFALLMLGRSTAAVPLLRAASASPPYAYWANHWLAQALAACGETLAAYDAQEAAYRAAPAADSLAALVASACSYLGSAEADPAARAAVAEGLARLWREKTEAPVAGVIAHRAGGEEETAFGSGNRVLVFAYAYRTLENFYPALLKMVADGVPVGIVIFPVNADPSSQRLAGVEHLLRVFPIPVLNDYQAFPLDDLERIVGDALDEFSPTHVIVDCILNYPSRSIYEIVRKKGPSRPVVVAMQQGLFQLWRSYEQNFACDHLLCYGDYAFRRIAPEFHHRLHAVGLPKLDRIEKVPVVEGEHILFLGGPSPRAEIAALALRELSIELQRPVRIKPHPEHIATYAMLRGEFAFEDSDADPVDLIAAAGMVITNGSTSSLEAMLMRKRLAILPTYKCVDFADVWTCVAIDYSGKWLHHALTSWDRFPGLADRYLEDMIGGRAFDSTARFIATLRKLEPV